MTGQWQFPDSMSEVKRLIVRYHRRFVLACFLVPAAVLGGALLLPKSYDAEASFERRNDLVMAEITDRGAPQAFSKLKQALSTELGGLPSVEKAVNDLRLVGDLPANATAEQKSRHASQVRDLSNRLKKNLRVQFDVSTPEVDRVRLILSDEDPVRARAVVNRLVENYMKNARVQVDQMLKQAAGFFENQVGNVRNAIDKLEQQKLKFELSKGELLPDENGQWTRSIPNAEERRDQAKNRLAEIDNHIAALKTELANLQDKNDAATSVVKARNPRILDIETQIRDYQKKLDQSIVIKKMTDRHPEVVAIKQRLAELQAELKEQPEEIVSERVFSNGESPRKTQLELSLLDLNTQRVSALNDLRQQESQVAKLKSQSNKFYEVRAEYRKIERQIEDQQRQLTFWDNNLMRIRVAETAESERRGVSMNFLKPCDEISRPTSPDFLQVIFAAGVLGIIAGTALMLISYRSDETYDGNRPSEPPLSAPVIGAIRPILTGAEKVRRGMVLGFGYPAATAAMLTVLAGIAYLNYRSLRTPQSPAAITAEAAKPTQTEQQSPAVVETPTTPPHEPIPDR